MFRHCRLAPSRQLSAFHGLCAAGSALAPQGSPGMQHGFRLSRICTAPYIQRIRCTCPRGPLPPALQRPWTAAVRMEQLGWGVGKCPAPRAGFPIRPTSQQTNKHGFAQTPPSGWLASECLRCCRAPGCLAAAPGPGRTGSSGSGTSTATRPGPMRSAEER